MRKQGEKGCTTRHTQCFVSKSPCSKYLCNIYFDFLSFSLSLLFGFFFIGFHYIIINATHTHIQRVLLIIIDFILLHFCTLVIPSSYSFFFFFQRARVCLCQRIICRICQIYSSSCSIRLCLSTNYTKGAKERERGKMILKQKKNYASFFLLGVVVIVAASGSLLFIFSPYFFLFMCT